MTHEEIRTKAIEHIAEYPSLTVGERLTLLVFIASDVFLEYFDMVRKEYHGPLDPLRSRYTTSNAFIESKAVEDWYSVWEACYDILRSEDK